MFPSERNSNTAKAVQQQNYSYLCNNEVPDCHLGYCDTGHGVLAMCR